LHGLDKDEQTANAKNKWEFLGKMSEKLTMNCSFTLLTFYINVSQQAFRFTLLGRGHTIWNFKKAW
jgi:hypothetical protein